MTIFVASLFLPHTVSFDISADDGDASLPSLSRSSTISRPGTSASQTTGRRNSQALSLFNADFSFVPRVQTPGATTDHERIFILPQQDVFNTGKAEAPNEATTGAPDEPHSPGWGKTFAWRQPPSRAKSPPPISVTKYKSSRERTASVLWRAQYRYKALEKARSSLSERYFSESNFSVVPPQMGNGGLRNAINAACVAGLLSEKTWVGTLGMPTDALSQHVKSSIAEKLEDDYDSLPVYVDDNDFDGHYTQYCKSILWPIFHYQVPDSPKSKAYEDHSWIHYVKLNEAFADRIVRNWKRGDVVWINDYHLLLVPTMLRKALPDAQIGFFLHVAFPSSEIFRCLAFRKELLEGLLGANLIGFQTDEYGHHFLQTCSRLLNVEVSKQGILLDDGRFVHVDTFPVGIDPLRLDQRREIAEVSDWIQTISEKYQGKRIIVARDKLDNIRGVRQKMLAYELFLNRYPQYRDKVVLIQIANSTTEQTELEATVSDIVTRINSTHSTLAHQPLVFLKQDINFSQYLALLSVAECLMITSLREGMNLTSHEYVYCQDGKYSKTKYGSLILSEFTGSASVFENHDLLVNPWDYKACAEAIKKALDMKHEERKLRWHSLYGTVMHHSAIHWYQSFLHHLEAAWKEHSVRDSTAVPRLSTTSLVQKYQDAGRRLFILDYEGTLASFDSPSDITIATPTRAVDVLNDVTTDPRNTVYVMSSRMPEEMERLFRQVHGLGLIAENGCFLREAGSTEWTELVDMEHTEDWMEGVRAMLQYYLERIEGSKLHARHCSLIFDYSEAEDEAAAFKQAGECANHINDACLKQDVQALPVDGALIIGPTQINKASATKLISDKIQREHEETGAPLPDFVLVVGDSRDDEYVFDWAHKLEQKYIGQLDEMGNPNTAWSAVTVTLGSSNTQASATLTRGVTGVLSILGKLAALY